MSRNSRSAIKKNRTMKFYFVIYIFDQLHGDVTLTMWKLSKRRLFPILKERTRGAKTVLASSFLRIFLLCLDIEVLYLKVINQATNSKYSDLRAFHSLQTTLMWWVLYHRRESRYPENSGKRKRKSGLWQEQSVSFNLS